MRKMKGMMTWIGMLNAKEMMKRMMKAMMMMKKILKVN